MMKSENIDVVLDRIPSKPDPVRRELFDVADAEIAGVPVAELKPRPYTWHVPFHLNQGREGACVMHGCVHEAVARPKPVTLLSSVLPGWAVRTSRVRAIRGHNTQMLAQALAFDGYDECRRTYDEWPGMNYSGTSASAGAKVMRELGLWLEYRWATNVFDFATGMSRFGPGCIAVDWYTGMMNTDSEGFIHPTGQVEGGHQLLAMSYTERRFPKKGPCIGLWQSWGDMPVWWITMADLEQVVASNGEMVLPTIRGL
jgi:hypothetical protein